MLIALAAVGGLLTPLAPTADAAVAATATANQATPTGRAAVPLSRIANLDHTLRGNYHGAAPEASFSSPAVADVTGDGLGEIVTATVDGFVITYRPDRSRLWSRDVGRTSIQSSPATADLTGDGKADVVVGTMDGRVLVLDGPTGRVMRTYSDGGVQGCNPLCFPRGFFGTPTIADLNGDRSLDVIASSYNHHIYAWSRSGAVIFKRNLYDTIWSSPVVADIDDNGTNEVIVGGDVDDNNGAVGGPGGGFVWVLRRDGSNYTGYPKRFPGQTIWSSPAVGDINRDGNLDIVVGSGAYWPDPAGRKVIALTARTGRYVPGWPVTTQGRVVGSPAIGDLNGDGRPEVVWVSEGGYLDAYHGNGTRRFRVCDRGAVTLCAPGNAGTHSSVALADVDADGEVEIVSAVERKLRVRSGLTGAVESEMSLGGVPDVVASGTPSIGEIGGRTVIVYQGHVRQGHSQPYARGGDLHRLQLATTNTGLCVTPWSSFKGGPERSGREVTSIPRWTPFACPGPFVDQQYRDFLDRAPDAAGRAYWTTKMHHQGRSGPWVIESFLRSPEFGGVMAPVLRSHFALFGTYPRSTAVLRADAQRIRRGTTIAQVTDDLVADDPTLSGLGDPAFVDEVYGNLYGRTPTTTERANALDLLDTMSRGTWVTLHSEWGAKPGLASEVDVAMVYLGMLDRAPDAAGFAFWVRTTDATGPARLIRGFQGSPEYARRVL